MNAPLPAAQQASADEVDARVRATIRPKIRALTAYPVAKATGMIKLDAMENPYGLSGEARAEIAAAVANARINRYPDGGGDEVKAALRRSLALSDDVALNPRQRFRRAAAAADNGGRQARGRGTGAGTVLRAVPDDCGNRQPALCRRAVAAGSHARPRDHAGRNRAIAPRAGVACLPEQSNRDAVFPRLRSSRSSAQRPVSWPSTRRTTRSPKHRSCPACWNFPT